MKYRSRMAGGPTRCPHRTERNNSPLAPASRANRSVASRRLATVGFKRSRARVGCPYFRIYRPEQPAFDGSWKPGDFEALK